MGHCGGNCAACSGCARELVLTGAEVDFLRQLGQYAFLPVARKMGEAEPVFLEEGDAEQMSLLLQCLEKKGLISLDYTKPLAGAAYSRYAPHLIRGSIGLTERGQNVLELLDYQGIT